MHLAIILDGNGRWATAQGLDRLDGHRRGVEAVRKVVEAAPRLGIRTLTVYAFSADNWKRGPRECDGLMRLLEQFLNAEARRCRDQGIRLNAIGRRDRLPPRVAAALDRAERLTAAGSALHLRIALDYSARQSIEAAIAQGARRAEDFERCLGPAVDLLIRTGGEQRLSDFLLWECAYAELYFTPVMWPEFTGAHLETALADFRRRERRFGAVPAPAA